MEEAIIDTDILSEVLKRKNSQVLLMAEQYLAEHQHLAFSAFTVYEIVRGMRANHATRQLNEFFKVAGTSDVYPISMSVLMRASELWTEAKNKGYPQGDADLIIAATAIEAERVLITGNTSHFDWIPELTIQNWRET